MKSYNIRLRARLEGNVLYGHAAVFNQVARVPGGYERFHPEAFDEVLARSEYDTVALFNHDMSMLLGRQSSGTLRLKIDEEGLPFEVDLPDTQYAHDLKVLVARGDISTGSVGYVPQKEEYSRAPDGLQMTTVTSVGRLRDISPVTIAAYSGTSVSLRHMDFGTATPASQLIRARHRVLRKGL